MSVAGVYGNVVFKGYMTAASTEELDLLMYYSVTKTTKRVKAKRWSFWVVCLRGVDLQ